MVALVLAFGTAMHRFAALVAAVQVAEKLKSLPQQYYGMWRC
jgi:hypothetical protein